MVSLNVQLEDAAADVLRQLAAEQNRTESEILQEALAAFAQSRRPLPKGIGKYRSGQSDTSTRARQILRDAAKEGQWP